MGNLNREGKLEIRAPKLLFDQVLYHITLTGVSLNLWGGVKV